MRKIQLHTAALIVTVSTFTLSCGSRKSINPDDLPKDISLKPKYETGSSEAGKAAKVERQMRELQTKINDLVNSRICTDPGAWRITPMGSKACGGPAKYIAYHVDVEEELLVLVRDYTVAESEYNMLKRILSDCAITPQPSGIICENGRPRLLNHGDGRNQSLDR